MEISNTPSFARLHQDGVSYCIPLLSLPVLLRLQAHNLRDVGSYRGQGPSVEPATSASPWPA